MSEYGSRLVFDENGEATCEESKEKYELIDGTVKEI